MARKATRKATRKTVETLKHDEDKRKNIPTAEYQSVVEPEQQQPVEMRYPRNTDLDPQLVWRGKDEQDWSDLVVHAPPLYIQEKVHPKALIDDLLRQTRESRHEAGMIPADLFADFNGIPRGVEKTEFYQHDQNWSNRMILGDSLQVMASLAEREGLRGKMQCIYFDPPYGIKFNSNFQWSTTSRDVKDGNADHITREPEQVKAFRDTWRDGIHSYLTYLRDRLTVARDLLTESGSIFVQIGDANVHRVRAVMDEVLGEDNFIGMIWFRKKTMPLGATYLERMGDYIIWFGKNATQTKFRRLFKPIDIVGDFHWNWRQADEAARRKFSKKELDANPPGDPFRLVSMWPPSFSEKDVYDLPFRGRKWPPAPGQCYPSGTEKLERVAKADRFEIEGQYVRYVMKLSDDDTTKLNLTWMDTVGARDQRYVVETNEFVVQRCILMVTDPGDLVLDPTCVRKGTRVLTPLGPPACGGKSESPSPLAGRVGEGFVSLAGRVGEGSEPLPGVAVGCRPIEDIQVGEWVLTHDGTAHRVLRTLRRRFEGRMIGIRHSASTETLWLTDDHLVLTPRRVTSLTPSGGWSGIPATHVAYARDLRKNMTPPEAILWSRLRGGQLGFRVRRQHQIGPYIADFYVRSASLVVEVDGKGAHGSDEAQTYDRERDAYMGAMGLRVLRFSAAEVSDRTAGVVEVIAQACREHVLPEDPTRQWRYARNLQVGDTVYYGADLVLTPIVELLVEETTEEVFDLEIDGTHSFLTGICAVHNCGSGTTATVAEQWGRRWITIDTSRVALALARARIMGARYPFYLLADSREGQIKEAEVTRAAPSSQPAHGNIRHGFVYERVPHITLKSIANNAEIDVIWEEWQGKLEPLRESLNAALKKTWQEWEIPREADAEWSDTVKNLHADWWQARIARQREIDASIAAKAEFEYLYDKPYDDKKKVRVAGPFTVESLSPHRVLGVDEDDELIDTLKEGSAEYGTKQSFPQMILDNLKTAGVQQAHKEDRITFRTLTSWPGDLVCAEGRYLEGETEKRAAIFIGPEFGTVQRADLVAAAREAGDGGFDVLIACAFNYEAHATEFSKLGRIPVLKARMNADLHMAEDLKNTGKGNLFVIFGEPDITLLPEPDGKLRVKVNGVDVFKPQTGEVISNGADGIACWFIDTDYNEESFFVRHAYFLGANEPYKALKTTLKAEIDLDAWATLNSDTSRAFEKPRQGRIAVKVINHLGDEVMKVFRV